jgi:hypothetical protein
MDDENPYRSPSFVAKADDGRGTRDSGADGREVFARRVIAVVLFGFAVLLFGRTVAAIEAARIAPSLILLSAVAATLLCWLGLNVWREAVGDSLRGEGFLPRIARKPRIELSASPRGLLSNR